MRIDPQNLNGRRKETKKSLLKALEEIGIKPKKPFEAIKRSDGEYDICIDKKRIVLKIQKGGKKN